MLQEPLPGSLWIDDAGTPHDQPTGQGLAFIRHGRGWVVARYSAAAGRLTGRDRHPRTGPISLKGALYCGEGMTDAAARALAAPHQLPA